MESSNAPHYLPLELFPNETLLHLFRFLCSGHDLLNVSQVCQRWRAVAWYEQGLWKKFCYLRWRSNRVSMYGNNWRNCFLHKNSVCPVRVNRIVVQGKDGNLFIVNPEYPLEKVTITNDASFVKRYQQPTFSPCGTRIAFSITSITGPHFKSLQERPYPSIVQNSFIATCDLQGHIVTMSQTENPPFYILWTYDATRFSFLCASRSSFERTFGLYLVDIKEDGYRKCKRKCTICNCDPTFYETVLLDKGSPFFLSQSPVPEDTRFFIHKHNTHMHIQSYEPPYIRQKIAFPPPTQFIAHHPPPHTNLIDLHSSPFTPETYPKPSTFSAPLWVLRQNQKDKDKTDDALIFTMIANRTTHLVSIGGGHFEIELSSECPETSIDIEDEGDEGDEEEEEEEFPEIEEEPMYDDENADANGNDNNNDNNNNNNDNNTNNITQTEIEHVTNGSNIGSENASSSSNSDKIESSSSSSSHTTVLSPPKPVVEPIPAQLLLSEAGNVLVSFIASKDHKLLAYRVGSKLYISELFPDSNVVPSLKPLPPRMVGDFRVMIAFYWAPNSRFLLWCTLEREGQARWWIHDYAREKTYGLSEFIPNKDFLDNYMRFFCQYEQGMTLFSPDSNYFVYATFTGEIMIHPVQEGSKPIAIAEGTFASWSPI
eukprot:TRINITY_DN1121_c0_g1_i5.p1 TRINITY_DN1121_c0_g1~~TRINITY_DN1121_c0_g1_i5.p1  ORF type:complete len:654 (-),score=109.99 TRINITY_DN1121_c0_g1_i5:30-1991(-)